jgi:hypothetical protein
VLQKARRLVRKANRYNSICYNTNVAVSPKEALKENFIQEG